ncbi:hypothetical protein N566_15100, partial [Streptomycetaceae bacterium MP113-05]
MAAPENAPALVLAVPGEPTSATRGLAEEILSIARSELPGLDARIGYVEGDGEEFPGLTEVLARAAGDRATGSVFGPDPTGGGDPQVSDALPAVVVPLLAGPDAAHMRQIRQKVLNSGSGAELTDVLGPHPLLAEAVHVKLSESGLARADRARLFTVATAADGIIIASLGGEDAVQAAGITGMLLAARLAVPVLAAGLDEEGAVARAAQQLRDSGSQHLAVAPCLIGPEIPAGLLEAATDEAGCSAAEPLGPYPALGKLVAATYGAKLGLPQQPAPGTPVR